jgi:hypothetical protein
MWGNQNNQAAKKIKNQQPSQNLIKKGNWGKFDPENTNNLGFFGFRGTPQENAQLGATLGKMKVNR